MDHLPFVDEHVQWVAQRPEAIWSALVAVLRRDMGASAAIARALGCDPADATATFEGRPGESVPGFRVVEAEPGQRLVLRGRHHFADYALAFLIDGEALRARTHAAFPGVRGRIHRAAVIGSGGHRLATRRMLRHVVREVARPQGDRTKDP